MVAMKKRTVRRNSRSGRMVAYPSKNNGGNLSSDTTIKIKRGAKDFAQRFEKVMKELARG